MSTLNPGRSIESHARPATPMNSRRSEMTARRAVAEADGVGPAPLILLAHGSRYPWANESIINLACQCDVYPRREVRAAFLEFATQTLAGVAQELRDRGYPHAIVVPLFFTDAYHLNNDVPREIAHAEHSTGIRILQTDPIGLDHTVSSTLVSHWKDTLRKTGTNQQPFGDAVVYSVGSSTPSANAAVEEFAQHVGRELGLTARALFATGGGTTLTQHRAELHRVSADTDTPPTAVLPLFFTKGILLDRAIEEAKSLNVFFGKPLDEATSRIIIQRMAQAENRASQQWMRWSRTATNNPYLDSDLRTPPKMII